MGLEISKSLSFIILLILIPIALLVFGSLAQGSGSFWYGINNPNTTDFNESSGSAQGTLTGGAITLETIVLPLGIVVFLIIVFLGFILKFTRGG